MHHYHEAFNCAPKVFDDVTFVNSISFSSLQSNQEVEQVWMNQGSIKYRMKDSPEVVNTVMDPFSLSHPDMSKRPILVTNFQRTVPTEVHSTSEMRRGRGKSTRDPP